MSPEPEAGRDGGDEERRSPCLNEARRAAAVLAALGTSRVLVYGSVARGDQHAGSDINLVAIFDDLDYHKRWEVRRVLCFWAWKAAGRLVDVQPTDWPEWTMRTRDVSSSFEAHIAADAVVLWDREPREVRWAKPMVTPTSNLEEAKQHLRDVALGPALRVAWSLEDFLDEPPPLVEQPRVEEGEHRTIGNFCKDATLALWHAIRVMVCLHGAYPPRLSRDLDFAGIVTTLPPGVRAQCAPWAGEVAKIDVSGHESTCGDPWCCFPTAPGSETVEIARTLAGAAARAAIEACEQMHRTPPDAGDNTDGDHTYYLRTAERGARQVLALLEVWDPPITGAAAPEAPAEPAGAPPAGT